MSKKEFLENMKSLLGENYGEFEKSLDLPAFRGLYVNALKCDIDKFKKLFGYDLKQTPFSDAGFYIDSDTKKLGTTPLHHAGAFYLQEPSAMSVASVVNAKEGDKVLDLCAAPGGKSTAIANALKNSGLLWSNEYVKSRAFTLLSNMERIGVKNAVISNSSPEALACALEGFFDKVLVDAPCSGEGMLRREKAEYDNWNTKNISICVSRQKSILNNATKMLKSGGELTYSTCTFNKEENEDIALWFLENHPEFEILDIENRFGRDGFGLKQSKLIFPADGGEGHFIVKFRKGEDTQNVKFSGFTYDKVPNVFREFWESTFNTGVPENILISSSRIYIIPSLLPKTEKINIIRAGILAGEIKGKTFFPHHNLFSSAKIEECKNYVDLPLSSPLLLKFLHGEEIPVSEFNVNKGWCAVFCEGIALGFGKVSGGQMKNHYPKGLRNLV